MKEQAATAMLELGPTFDPVRLILPSRLRRPLKSSDLPASAPEPVEGQSLANTIFAGPHRHGARCPPSWSRGNLCS